VVKAMELAQESAYTPTELMAYDEYLDAIRVQQTVRADSFKEGQEEERKKSEAKLEEERKKSEAKLEEERKKSEAKLEEERKMIEEERKKNEQEKRDMARKMLAKRISIEDVNELTNLPMDVIRSLRP
jgi:hypothetical protein